MKLTKRNVEALVLLEHGDRVRGRRSGGAIARMYGRLEKAGLIEWQHGMRVLTVAGRNVVAEDAARINRELERQA